MAIAPAGSNSFESIPLESGPGTSGQLTGAQSFQTRPHYKSWAPCMPLDQMVPSVADLPSPSGGKRNEREASPSSQAEVILSAHVFISCAAVGGRYRPGTS